MYDLLLFDFDGVLFDTNQLKTKAFALALSDYPESKVSQLVQYHKDNGGISRQLKMQYFFEQIMQLPDSGDEQEQAVERFTEHCQALLPTASLLPGAADFLRTAKSIGVPLAICSGGNTDEIRKLLKRESLESLFIEIWGNEQSKIEHAERHVKPHFHHVCFFGDSQYDMEVAEQFGFDFCFLYGVTEWLEGENIAEYNGHVVVRGFEELVLNSYGKIEKR